MYRLWMFIVFTVMLAKELTKNWKPSKKNSVLSSVFLSASYYLCLPSLSLSQSGSRNHLSPHTSPIRILSTCSFPIHAHLLLVCHQPSGRMDVPILPRLASESTSMGKYTYFLSSCLSLFWKIAALWSMLFSCVFFPFQICSRRKREDKKNVITHNDNFLCCIEAVVSAFACLCHKYTLRLRAFSQVEVSVSCSQVFFLWRGMIVILTLTDDQHHRYQQH